MQREAVARALGYAGLMPFLGFLWGYAALEDYPQALAKQGMVIYSLAILAFLSGSQWRAGLDGDLPSDATRLLVSNGIVVFAVVAVLSGQLFLAVALLLLSFLALLWYEVRTDPVPHWYRRLRWQLTLGVVLSQAAFLGLLVRGA